MTILIIAGLVLVGLLVHDAEGLTCSRCVRPFAVFSDGRCWKCWREARRRSRA